MAINLEKQIYKVKPKNSKFYTVAIDGRGGSGKSTLSKYIKQLLPSFILLNGDDYFEPAYDHIAWGYFNDNRFIDDVIKPLQSKDIFIYKPYDWHKKPHISERLVKVNEGLILERGYSFKFELNWDFKIWVETSKEICFGRGVSRDHMQKEKNEKAWHVWQSEEDIYINKQKPRQTADLVLDGTLPFEDQLI